MKRGSIEEQKEGGRKGGRENGNEQSTQEYCQPFSLYTAVKTYRDSILADITRGITLIIILDDELLRIGHWLICAGTLVVILVVGIWEEWGVYTEVYEACNG